MEYHTELQMTLMRHLVSKNHQLLCEYRLPNGKVADIISISGEDRLSIYEVKTTLTPSIIEYASKKYSPYCNIFCIAAPEHEVLNALDAMSGNHWTRLTRLPSYILFGPNTITEMISPNAYGMDSKVQTYLLRNIADRIKLLSDHQWNN